MIMKAGRASVTRIWSNADRRSHQFVSSPYWLKRVSLDLPRIASHCVGSAALRSAPRLLSARGLKWMSDTTKMLLDGASADGRLTGRANRTPTSAHK